MGATFSRGMVIMPRTKLDADPKVDWPVAALLQRKLVLGYTWEDIADKAFDDGCSLTILGYPDSRAESYALENGYGFVPVT